MFKFQITHTINDHAMIIFNDLGDHLANNEPLLVKILARTFTLREIFQAESIMVAK